jgi:hypothetical protein
MAVCVAQWVEWIQCFVGVSIQTVQSIDMALCVAKWNECIQHFVGVSIQSVQSIDMAVCVQPSGMNVFNALWASAFKVFNPLTWLAVCNKMEWIDSTL